MTPGRWELRDHTADLLVHAEGDTVTELFAAATDALLDQLGCNPDALAGATEPVTLAAPELADLLVAWLQLLLHASREGSRPVLVRTLEVDNVVLRAELVVGREPVVPAREIKGVTYHGLAVGQDRAGRWQGDVLFDI